MNYEQKVVNVNFTNNNEYNSYLEGIGHLGWIVESTNSQQTKTGFSVSFVLKRNKDLKNYLRFKDLENKIARSSSAVAREKLYLFNKYQKDAKIFTKSRKGLKISFYLVFFVIMSIVFEIVFKFPIGSTLNFEQILKIILRILIVVVLIGGYIFAFKFFKKFKYELPTTNEYMEEIVEYEKELYNKGKKLNKEISN